MLFEEFQDGFFVDSHLGYLNGMIKAILGLHFALKTPHQFYCSRENMGWKMLFEEFHDGC